MNPTQEQHAYKYEATLNSLNSINVNLQSRFEEQITPVKLNSQEIQSN